MKKSLSKLGMRRRGVSSIIAASFLIIILFTSLSTVIKFNKKTSELNDLIHEMNVLNFERGIEDFCLIGVPFSSSNRLDITVINQGEISVSLKWVQVLKADTMEPVLEYTKIIEKILPGETKTGIGSDIPQTFPGGYEGSTSYIIQIWSDRGTVTSYKYPTLEKEYQIIINKYYCGPFEFILDSSSFRYTSKDIDGYKWNERSYFDNPENSEPAFTMYDYLDNIVYEIKLKNVSNSTVEVQASSFFLVIVPQLEGDGETELYNYIVSQESDSADLVRYIPDYSQIIEPGEVSILKFGSRTSRGDLYIYPNSLRGYQGNDRGSENLLTTYLIIFWRFEGTTNKFGLTIPLGSISIQQY